MQLLSMNEYIDTPTTSTYPNIKLYLNPGTNVLFAMILMETSNTYFSLLLLVTCYAVQNIQIICPFCVLYYVSSIPLLTK